MYYILEFRSLNKPNDDAFLKGSLLDNNNDLAMNIFTSGKSVAKKALEGYLIKSNEYSKNGIVGDFLITEIHSSPVLIVSEKLKAILLREASQSVEFFPVKIDNLNDKVITNYFICNVTKIYDCLDYAEAEYEYEYYNDDNEGEGDIIEINHLVIDNEEVPKDMHLFLIDNVSMPIIVISEELKNKLDSENITGIGYINAEGFVIE